jgi:chemotaxis response regulator CheB
MPSRKNRNQPGKKASAASGRKSPPAKKPAAAAPAALASGKDFYVVGIGASAGGLEAF